MKHKPLGQLLVQRSVLTPPKLREALELQRSSGNRLATECLERRLASEEDLLGVLSAQVGVPGIQLSRLVLPLAVLDLVPEQMAIKQLALPVRADAERLFLAMANPNGKGLISEVAFLSSRQIFPCVALAGALRKTISEAYAAKKRGELSYLGEHASESDPGQELGGLIYPRELTKVPQELLRSTSRSGEQRAVAAAAAKAKLEALARLPAAPPATLAAPVSPEVGEPEGRTGPGGVVEGRGERALERPGPILRGATADIVIEVDDGEPGDLIIPFEDDDDLIAAADHLFLDSGEVAARPASAAPGASAPRPLPPPPPGASAPRPLPMAPGRSAARPQPPQIPAGAIPPAAAEPGKPAIHVLVVDDDPELRRLVSRVLRGKGMQVQEASRGLEALNRIKSSPPELILLDAMLPEIHGFDICRKIKSSERYGHIPIIMISSIYRGWRIARDLQESYGVAAFLEKPFTIDMLWNTVERVLVSWSRTQQGRQTVAEAEARYREAVRRFKANDIDGAIESCREGLRCDPLSAKLHYRLGIIYLKKQGMLYQALQEFEEAIALDPELYSALRTLAILYQRKGFRNKAIDMWERALRCAPDDEAREHIRAHLKTLL